MTVEPADDLTPADRLTPVDMARLSNALVATGFDRWSLFVPGSEADAEQAHLEIALGYTVSTTFSTELPPAVNYEGLIELARRWDDAEREFMRREIFAGRQAGKTTFAAAQRGLDLNDPADLTPLPWARYAGFRGAGFVNPYSSPFSALLGESDPPSAEAIEHNRQLDEIMATLGCSISEAIALLATALATEVDWHSILTFVSAFIPDDPPAPPPPPRPKLPRINHYPPKGIRLNYHTRPADRHPHYYYQKRRHRR